MTSGRLSLRLALPAAIEWSFAPLLQVAALAAVWPWKRTDLTFARGIDSFFASQTVWSLWFCLFAAVWGILPPALVFSWTRSPRWWYGSAIAAGLVAAWLDYGFFRTVSRRSPALAVRDLIIERAIVWTAGLSLFLISSGTQVVAYRLGL
jgi:hypothetical protein